MPLYTSVSTHVRSQTSIPNREFQQLDAYHPKPDMFFSAVLTADRVRAASTSYGRSRRMLVSGCVQLRINVFDREVTCSREHLAHVINQDVHVC